jgi:hypothetical protein
MILNFVIFVRFVVKIVFSFLVAATRSEPGAT